MPPANGMWRLTAASGTDGSWSLYEIEMYQSTFCNATTMPEYGVPFASSAKTGEESPLVFDRDTQTRWTAGCGPCDPYEAWVAQSFPQERVIRCVRMFQPPPQPTP